jgi:putative hydroxymethylpyrimidine transport system substrate-binding protein
VTVTYRRHLAALRCAVVFGVAVVGLVAGCSGSSSSDPSTTAAVESSTLPGSGSAGDRPAGDRPAGDRPAGDRQAGDVPTAGEVSGGIDRARCDRNRAVGPIVFRTGLDFAAAASTIEWIVAKDKGYFEQLCLDVRLESSFTAANYLLVAAGKAQFASGGSYTEFLRSSSSEEPLQAAYVLGRGPMEVLIVNGAKEVSLRDLSGKAIGVKGDLPPSIQVMLSKAGLSRDLDYSTVSVDGFDPVIHLADPAVPIDALAGNRSFEPGHLERATVKHQIIDPLNEAVPGSFGVVFTSQSFAREHPEVTADVVRAALRGLADAVAEPAGAVAMAVAAIEKGGNPNSLSLETETFRWTVEARLIVDLTPSGVAWGAIDPAMLEGEVDDYTAAGIFPVKPDITATFLDGLVMSVSTPDGQVDFPG